jgi:hypothetical protein
MARGIKDLSTSLRFGAIGRSLPERAEALPPQAVIDESERVGRGTIEEQTAMTKVAAGITTSLDGYITGPDDGPGRGLGEGGERLHYWRPRGGAVDLDRAGGAGWRQAAVRRLRGDADPRAPAPAPVAVRHPHHLPRGALTVPGFELACHGVCISGVRQLELTPRRPNDHSPVRRCPRRIPRRGGLEEAA